MDPADVFELCAEQRLDLADWIVTLTDEQLATPSLCEGWSVKTVAAHLAVLIGYPKAKFLLTLLRHRGNFDRTNDAVSRAVCERSVAEIAEILRRRAHSSATPPVGGPRAPLTDLLVHTADMRLPLDVPLALPPAAVEVALDFLSAGGIGFIPRSRLRGIRLAPTDLDRTWGEGDELTGTAEDVLLGVCGRPVLDRLGGPGRDVLGSRI